MHVPYDPPMVEVFQMNLEQHVCIVTSPSDGGIEKPVFGDEI